MRPLHLFLVGAIDWWGHIPGRVVHPFLLADNRHLPFYLWKNFLSKESIREVYAPVLYAAAVGFLVLFAVRKGVTGREQSSLGLPAVVILPTFLSPMRESSLIPWNTSFSFLLPDFHPVAGRHILWILFSLVATVPSPLIEFRYFIIPTTLWFLNTMTPESMDSSHPSPSVSHRSIVLVTVLNLLLTVFVVFIFVHRPFLWPDGSVARFIL